MSFQVGHYDVYRNINTKTETKTGSPIINSCSIARIHSLKMYYIIFNIRVENYYVKNNNNRS